ncbi:DUF4838 domain-containing protein [Conexibacter woesei]|uniref:DUF4838 domain-containing protein n=1 Tax=Conexibacter woesei (strain DSM 14684 / CCUG 47730 / CIP 108061 / JCM 11494 / NBRC 100937 / ID131577) TaxID=469383 RepID=D3F845_CONWI|nr:DUF4838 domain-containing protein [Conexibacter woesei]ADB48915.1 hypothetical protein Cwoe_0480 [Conexibacter woesei DSM 14684]
MPAIRAGVRIALPALAAAVVVVPSAEAATPRCGPPGGAGRTVEVRIEPASAALGATVEARCPGRRGASLASGRVTLGADGRPAPVRLRVGGARVVSVRASLAHGFGVMSRRAVRSDGRRAVVLKPRRSGAWLTLVQNGTAHAVVTTPSGAPDRVTRAADRLVDYVRRSTGVELPRRAPLAGEIEIHVGGRPNGLAGLDGDGFVIDAAATADRIDVAGPTDWGTQIGVDEFLERYVGVRWLMPGADGEDVPQLQTLAVPEEVRSDEPANMTRQLSGLPGTVQLEWAERNRMHWRTRFHHGLYNVVPPRQYFAKNPEFFPERREPVGTTRWQPCFTEPGTVTAAIREIDAYFDANPAEESFSLGVNDSSGYCETNRDDSHYVATRTNSLGRAHMSEIYFRWVNEVVEGVLREHPDKWFGLLGYSEVNDPPEFQINPRVVVFVTEDRMGWIHPSIERQGHDQLAGWNAVARQVGFYDYIYGAPYAVPRFYPHRMAQTYRYAAANGVTSQYAENYANWGEGPKTWLALRLSWDPQADVDVLLREWFERAVGPDAAPALASYYDHWERFWTERIPSSAWFAIHLKPRRLPYLPFFTPTYMDLVTEDDLVQSRQWLEDAVRLAQTPAQRARAGQLLRAFEYYEASGRAYGKSEPAGEPADDAAALRLLSDVERRFTSARAALDLFQQFSTDPVLLHPTQMSPTRGGFLGSPNLPDGASAALVDWLVGDTTQSGATWLRLRTLAADPQASPLRSFARLLIADAEGRGSLLVNAGFETGTTPWSLWRATTVGTLARNAAAARTGTAGLRATGLERGGPTQIVPVSRGVYGAVARFRVPAGASAGGVQLTVNAMTADGRSLGQIAAGPIRSVATISGRWVGTEVFVNVPETVGGTAVARIQLVAVVDNVPAGAYVDLDDVGLYRLGD